MGHPDFLILDRGEYVIRDSKMSRRIDEVNHPEIMLQVGLYGYLFEKVCGMKPKSIQVHAGSNDIVNVPFDGGVSALAVLEEIARLKKTTGAPYEPVGWTKCGGCGFKERCWEMAEDAKDVALVQDVDQNLAIALHSQDVNSRADLLSSFDANSLGEFKKTVGTRQQKVGKRSERIRRIAASMETNQEMVLAAPAIPLRPNYVMFDLEGMPPYLEDESKIYLWGSRVFGASPGPFVPAVAGFGPDGDKAGWSDFLADAERIFAEYGNDIPFVHWAAYEKTHITLYMQRFGDPNGTAARVKDNLLDLLPVARDSIILPLPSYSLKVIEKYIGYQRTQTEFGGEWSIAKFIEATETEDVAKRDELMGEILQYNNEDLEATWAVFEWLRAKSPATKAAHP